MLSFDFAETTIIDLIPTARIKAAIAPNSGITTPSIIPTTTEAL